MIFDYSFIHVIEAINNENQSLISIKIILQLQKNEN